MSQQKHRVSLKNGIIALVVSGLCFGCWLYLKSPVYNPATGFEGTSDNLQHTVVTQTLDDPIPQGKSAIWCASFQLAWNRLKHKVVNGPIQLSNAQAIADQFNKSTFSEEDVGADAVYADAGLVKDGIVEMIQSEMAKRFPRVSKPDLPKAPMGAIAYAYLAASAKFTLPFFENTKPLLFKDAFGTTPVGAFGIREQDEYAYRHLRNQVEVLYSQEDSLWREAEIPEFVVDPCKTSQPYQIVLAMVPRKSTLAETLADVEEKVARQKKSARAAIELGARDTLLIPNLAFTIRHRFKDLQGNDKQFLNPALQGAYLDTAAQMIQFRLDRSGAELSSEAKVIVRPSASFFHVNRPFLLYMVKRGGNKPFLVMWVDNAELLQNQR